MIQGFAKAAKAALAALDAVPMGSVIKAAVGLGVMAFTAYVLIKRVRKMAKAKKERNYSPVDEILANDFVVDSEAYDDMDPEARKICKKLHRGGWKKAKKRKSGVYTDKKRAYDKRKKEEADGEVVSLFDNDEDEKEMEEGYIFQPHLFNVKSHQLKKRSKEQRARTRENIQKVRDEAIDFIDNLVPNVKNAVGIDDNEDEAPRTASLF